MIFASSSLVALWVSYIISSIKLDNYFSEVKISLENIPSNGDNGLLSHAMRSECFTDNGINDIFWSVYGRYLLTLEGYSETDKINKIFECKKSLKISITKLGDIYYFMGWMLLITAKEGQIYRATASENELKRDEPDGFLLDMSLRYAKHIHRIFYIKDEGVFHKISNQKKAILRKQVSNGANLMVYFYDQIKIDNFGIYGSISVGVLDEEKDENIFNFNKLDVENANRKFSILADSSEKIDKYL